jgi:tetratricopeptide (TPR) repeat protein
MKKKEKIKKKKTIKESPKVTLSPLKKKIFLGITIALPFLFLLGLEIGLRIFHYGGNLDLFIDGPEGFEQYYRVNPNVARRYFSLQANVPTPPKQLFLKNKPPNCYRIFVLGESTTAGFPYGYNVCFSNVLERALANTFSDKKIEVVNVAMAAINSYALLDFMDEVLKQSPDALLIYTGHNEYYGAMGVGSVQSVGSSIWITRLYLDLKSYKIFLFMRDCMGWIRKEISSLFYGGSEVDPSQTLMARIVADQTIPNGSPMYEAGKTQFKENMNAILKKASGNNVKVILSELVSNIHNQKPFISVNNNGESAEKYFELARHSELSGDLSKAKQYYFKAKDLDALRFRAPEEFNRILHELASKYSEPIVPMVSYFEENSPNGIIGNSLILEHLHPNQDGHYIMAKAFYDVLQSNKFISQNWKSGVIENEKHQGITELDSAYASLVIYQLKGSWPFQPKSVPNRNLQNFHPKNPIEAISLKIITTPNYSIESGHMQLGQYYEKLGKLDNAFSEYNALITTIPEENEFYEKAAKVLILEKNYDKASEILQKSLEYNNTYFALKWIGQIALMKEDYKNAIFYLTRSDMEDPQVVFNLSRSYYMVNQWYKGEEYFNRLRKLSPRSEYVAFLNKLRITSKDNAGKAGIN